MTTKDSLRTEYEYLDRMMACISPKVSVYKGYQDKRAELKKKIDLMSKNNVLELKDYGNSNHSNN